MARTKADRFALSVVEALGKSCHRGKSRIQSFIKYNRQVEGWFKGELLKIAADLEKNGNILQFYPDLCIDSSTSKRNIDLVYDLEGGARVWIELKHWYLGKYPGGANWSAKSYFTQQTSATPYNVISKIPPDWADPLYMLIVTTPRPKIDDWQSGLAQLKVNYPDRPIACLTKLSDYPEDYYLALLRL